MTENYSPHDGAHAATGTGGQGSTASGSSSSSTSETAKQKAGAAKDQAADVTSHAKDNAQQVAETAKTEAAGVASEVKTSAKDLFDQARTDLTSQAGTQQQKVAEGLRSISDELSAMARSSEQSGVATDLVQQAASRTSSAATWLDGRDPGSLLDEVKGFARQRPVAFLAIAAGAGLLAGRLSKGLSAGLPASNSTAAPTGSRVSAPATPAVPPPPMTEPSLGTGAQAPGTTGFPAAGPYGDEPTRAAGEGPASARTLPPTPVTGAPSTDPFSGGRH